MALRDITMRKNETGITSVGFSCDETGRNLEIAEKSDRVHINEVITIGDHLKKCGECAARYGERLFNLQKKLITQTAEDALNG